MTIKPENRAKEAPDFLIDDKTGALLNTNARGLQGYRVQRQQMRNTQNVAARIDSLEVTVSEIRELLLKALQK